MSLESEQARELTEHEMGLLAELVAVRDAIKVHEETEAKLKSQLASSLDTHTHGLIDDTHVVTISRSRPERFDLPSFRRDHDLLARAYMKPADNEMVRVLPRQAARDLILQRGASILEA